MVKRLIYMLEVFTRIFQEAKSNIQGLKIADQQSSINDT